MDPRDRPFDLVAGAECAACGLPVARDRVRLLASRDDIAFAELPCEPCGSVSLAIFVAGSSASEDRVAPAGPDRNPGAVATPVDADDVLDMHELLAGWHGDLRSLLGGGDDGARPPR